jgi:putative CocE/NonD family hydrolase
MSQDQKKPTSSMEVLERAGRGQAPAVDFMPQADVHLLLPMRDGTRLDTFVWLPADRSRPAPAILSRTPYIEKVTGWKRLNGLGLVANGFALVMQVLRGVPPSEGEFTFNSPFDRTDGYDTVEWIAAQPWCSGAVGMTGSSYSGMTQLTTAAARPPHLKAIAVHVPSVDFFREIPYHGGGFSRLHSINWTNIISIQSLAELTGGFMSAMPILSQLDWLARIRSRPVVDASDEVLSGDKRKHYRDVLAHPTFDDWWKERTIGPADFAAMDLPILVVNGNFDMGIGANTLWRGLEANAPRNHERNLLIGPWDHGQSYVGGGPAFGPYDFAGKAELDLHALRIAFFNQHLKGEGPGVELGDRVRLYITGANEWRTFDAFPPREAPMRSLYLSSGGRANTVRGDGLLTDAPPAAEQPADQFIADPELPFVPTLASADPALAFDLREAERCSERLVYSTAPLEAPLTVAGEGAVTLHVAADVPDADIAVQLGEARADGQVIRLATGFLRLRYREGFDREVPLTPGRPVEVRIPLTYVGHQLPAGSRLRLLISGDNFPLIDPNPHTGEPIATAVRTQVAHQSVLHDGAHPSRLELPVLG